MYGGIQKYPTAATMFLCFQYRRAARPSVAMELTPNYMYMKVIW